MAGVHKVLETSEKMGQDAWPLRSEGKGSKEIRYSEYRTPGGYHLGSLIMKPGLPSPRELYGTCVENAVNDRNRSSCHTTRMIEATGLQALK